MDRKIHALFQALETNDVDRLKQVLASGVSANSENDNGQTALTVASSQGNTEIIEALIAAGAEIDRSPKPLVFNPQISGTAIPGGANLQDLIDCATEDADETTKNFYAGFMQLINAFSGEEILNETRSNSGDRTESSEIIVDEIAKKTSTNSNTEKPIPLLFASKKGSYFGTDAATLSEKELENIKEIDRQLKEQSFQLLGKLTFSHFTEIETYAYVSPDRSICASVMTKQVNSFFGLGKNRSIEVAGLDLVTCFTDDTFLTTTTTKLQIKDYPAQKLFRRSHPNLSVADLYTRHLEYVAEFNQLHGKSQQLFSDLCAIAVMIDIYLQRQETNPNHQIATFVNAIGILNKDNTDSSDNRTIEDLDEEDLDEEDLEDLDEEAKTPLMAAVISGNVETVKALLNAGAKVNPDAWYESPCLAVAARKGYVEIVRELIAAGANVDRGFEYPPITEAASKGHTEVVRLLIEAGAEIDATDEDGGTALMDAAYFGHSDTVKLLVDGGADVNAWGQGATPLLRAADGGQREVYNFLYPLVEDDIRRRADRDGEKTIQATIKRKEREKNKAVEKFIEAAMYGKLEKVRGAIADGINVNAIGSKGQTALMYAASYGHISIIQVLLDAGADPNILSEEGGIGEEMTALMHVVSSFFANNRAEIVKLLVRSGADVNLKGIRGQTALMFALKDSESVKALIEAGADLNARDDRGNSVLMLAHTQGNFKVRKLLEQ
jgi:ankyrin repeat protein